MKTLSEFISEHKLKIFFERADSNPAMAANGGRDMDHWKVKITSGRKQYTVTFSKGFGHNGRPPELSEVLDCLASDAATIENARTFEEWAGELGYDADSRSAEKTYNEVQKQAARLKAFLGADDYRALLFETERA